jgi:hypothetical protein
VGLAPVADVTVAVNVTDCPALDGFGDVASAVVVVTAFTTWETAAEVLGASFVEPP